MNKAEKIMEKHDVTHEDLVLYHEANRYLSRQGSEAKLKKIPLDDKERMDNFYKDLRANGMYSNEPKNGRMTFYRISTYEEMEKEAHQAPDSLAKMEPPKELSFRFKA